jgi:hypothetical protein
MNYNNWNKNKRLFEAIIIETIIAEQNKKSHKKRMLKLGFGGKTRNNATAILKHYNILTKDNKLTQYYKNILQTALNET